MGKTVELLLTENVDSLGIVGDIVTVKVGFARNYLLPRQMATPPSDEMIARLAEQRAKAERELGELRTVREGMIQKMDGLEITLERSCNDQGVLYGSVTQQDIASALGEVGYPVKPREVRLSQSIKRIDTYEVLVRFAADLETAVKIWVVPDRELDTDEREEMEFDNEGNLIEKPRKKPAREAEQKSEQEAEPAKA